MKSNFLMVNESQFRTVESQFQMVKSQFSTVEFQLFGELTLFLIETDGGFLK